MSLIFLDSFDHYGLTAAAINTKWNGIGGSGIALSTIPGMARTGAACLTIVGAYGPTRMFGANIADVLVGGAFYTSAWVCSVLYIDTWATYAGLTAAAAIDVRLNSVGAIEVYRGAVGNSPPATLLATSVPGIVPLRAYSSVVCRARIHQTLGTVSVWVNGVLVIQLSGVNTTNPYGAVNNFADGFTLMGPGGTPDCRWDDVYAFNCSAGGANSSFPGGFPKIYAAVPFANGAPVNWTPLGGGSNYTEVDEIPPDGDTSYNSSATVAQQDQYQYNPTGVPANSQILAIQHNLTMRVDSGARSVASSIGANVGTGVALTATYLDRVTPWDLNPDTGFAWAGGDFPKSFGPYVTA